MTCERQGCKLNVLMDGFCIKHLKQTCSICMESVSSLNTSTNKRLQCGHAFHTRCILRWFAASDDCPTCRHTQKNDPFILFKKGVEDQIRHKYRDAIRSLEIENRRLNETISRQMRAYR